LGDFDEFQGDEGHWDVTVKRREHVSTSSRNTLEVVMVAK